jgi:hypothetical protein
MDPKAILTGSPGSMCTNLRAGSTLSKLWKKPRVTGAPLAGAVQLTEETGIVEDATPLRADGGGACEHLGSRQQALEDLELEVLRQASYHGGAVQVETWAYVFVVH